MLYDHTPHWHKTSLGITKEEPTQSGSLPWSFFGEQTQNKTHKERKKLFSSLNQNGNGNKQSYFGLSVTHASAF